MFEIELKTKTASVFRFWGMAINSALIIRFSFIFVHRFGKPQPFFEKLIVF